MTGLFYKIMYNLHMKSREAKKISDYQFISSLFNPSNTKYMLVKNISADEIKDDHSSFKKYFIVSNNKEFIGYYNIFLSSDKKSARVALVVNKPFQNKGFGTKIMKTIEKQAKKYGVKKLKLDVMAENIHAINLYNKMGYDQTHKLVFMEKNL